MQLLSSMSVQAWNPVNSLLWCSLCCCIEEGRNTMQNGFKNFILASHFQVPSPQQALRLDLWADLAGQCAVWGWLEAMITGFPGGTESAREGIFVTWWPPVWRPLHYTLIHWNFDLYTFKCRLFQRKAVCLWWHTLKIWWLWTHL